MPSIELFCVDQRQPLISLQGRHIEVIADSHNVSHRGAASRFQHLFSHHDGVLYHLGEPQPPPARSSFFTAYGLLSEACLEADPPSFLMFKEELCAEMDELLNVLLDASPSQRLIWTSDWQFGPSWVRYHPPLTCDDLWLMHHDQRLNWHTAYPLVAACST